MSIRYSQSVLDLFDRFAEHSEVEAIHFCTSVISTHENSECVLKPLGFLPSEN